jgi:acetone carboxylase gamma subunit
MVMEDKVCMGYRDKNLKVLMTLRPAIVILRYDTSQEVPECFPKYFVTYRHEWKLLVHVFAKSPSNKSEVIYKVSEPQDNFLRYPFLPKNSF